MSEFGDDTVFEFTSLSELDPSVADGFRIVYDREVPMEVRTENSSGDADHGTMESIKVKLLMLGPEEAPSSIRLEFSSEADLFFAFMHEMDDDTYRNVQENQKLMVPFVDYPNVLIRMLNSVIREPAVFLAIFLMNGRGEARLDFIQNMEYKFVELVSCKCDRMPEEVIAHHVTYRYNSIKQKYAVASAKLNELSQLVKTKNPSLMLHMQKTAAGPMAITSTKR